MLQRSGHRINICGSSKISEQLEMNPNVEISMKWGTILLFPASEEPQEEMFLYLFDL